MNTVANEKEVILSVKDLQVTFGSGKKSFTAVQNVNFDVYKGETFSLVGESGSGKTTLRNSLKENLIKLRKEGVWHYSDLPFKIIFRFFKMCMRGY